MAIKYKVVAKGQPGVVGGGDKKFYATPVLEGEVTLNDLTRLIEMSSTVSGADIRAVLYALVEITVDSLSKGSIVRLGELGSLRPSLSSEGRATEVEVNASAIRNTSVIFAPGSRIKEMLAAVKFTKA